jgi:hypothetical protein
MQKVTPPGKKSGEKKSAARAAAGFFGPYSKFFPTHVYIISVFSPFHFSFIITFIVKKTHSKIPSN